MEGDGTFELRFSEDRAREFVDQLVNDEAFRQAVMENPRAKLAEYEITVPPEFIPATVTLPSIDELKAWSAATQEQTTFRAEVSVAHIFPGLLFIIFPFLRRPSQ